MFYSAVVVLILFWLCIHLLNALIFKKRSPILPLTRRNKNWTRFSVNGLHLRIQTSALNVVLHDRLTVLLRSKRPLLRLFYDVGTVAGILGMGVGIGLLFWTTTSLFFQLFVHSTSLVKRSLQPRSSVITPIIPGITVPLNHAFPILLAVFVSQLTHELGHAAAAALDSIPVISSGVSLTLCIPAAFVAFSTTALEALPRRARARVISAGAWHNIVFYALLLLAGYLGLGYAVCTVLGYEDISSFARVVVSVHPASALHDYLPTGSIITYIDDEPLQVDTWNSYLKEPSNDLGRGWCIPPPPSSDHACCSALSSSTLACFASVNAPRTSKSLPRSPSESTTQPPSEPLIPSDTVPSPLPTHLCLDPVLLLTDLDAPRCSASGKCADDALLCVRPRLEEELVRLRVLTAREGGEVPFQRSDDKVIQPDVVKKRHGSLGDKIILWKGPKEEILQQVTVSTWTHRLGLLPVWVPVYASVFYGYLLMANASLFVLNLLPLPFLDGEAFLDVIVDGSGNGDTEYVDLESGSRLWRGDSSEGGAGMRTGAGHPRRRGRWKNQVVQHISRLLVAVVGVCVVLGMADYVW